MAHCFDLNYERTFYPCNDIRCCGPEHDDSDIDSVRDDAENEVEVEVEVVPADEQMDAVDVLDAEMVD